MPEHSSEFLAHVSTALSLIDSSAIDRLAMAIADLRARNGRLFVIGLGGSAAHAAHATADFRKLCDVEAYAPADNVAELTARANDEGWETIFSGWLQVSRLSIHDALFVISVGGGDAEANISVPIIRAVELAQTHYSRVFAILGREGYVAHHADPVVIIPQVHPAVITPITEGLTSVIWHCLVSHPVLQRRRTVW